MPKVDIAGLKIDQTTKVQLLNELRNRIASGQKTWLTTPYSEFLHAGLLDPGLMDLLNRADIAVPDGIGLFWARMYLLIPLTAKSYWGKIFQAAWQIKYSLAAIIFNSSWINSALPEKISGSDLIWDLAKLAAENNFSIYLLGGFGDTANIADQQLKTKNPKLKTYYSNKNPGDESAIDDINKIAPDILLVAYGPIKQEKWIANNLSKLNVKLAVGLGGTFDYIAGKRIQPPKAIRKIGLEWLWRLITQPYRAARIWRATFGLAGQLWHYKVFTNLPLRSNVAIVILNQKNQVLLGERNPRTIYVDIITNQESLKQRGYWQLPQGGIDGKEDLIEAAKHEALEETGIKNLKFIKTSAQTNTYIWNNALRKFSRNRKFQNRGQIQNIMYFRFLGQNNEINDDDIEFIAHKWVAIGELSKIAHPERINLIKIVTNDLKEMSEKGII